MPVEITLGGVTVPVIPQRHAYIQHRIGPAIQAAIDAGEGLSNDKLGEWLGAGAYGVLSALIPTLPALIPEHIFQGYVSADAYAAGQFDEDAVEHLAGCPTIAEIDEAFRTAMQVNGIAKLVELGKGLIDPKLAKALVSQKIAESINSPTSLSPNGESDSTSSGTPPPTWIKSEDSPSPVSPA